MTSLAWGTYAAVAANISTLRALVKIARIEQKMIIKRPTLKSRTSMPSIKYRATMDVTGIVEDRRVTKMVKPDVSFESLYSANPASSSSDRLRKIRRPIEWWKAGRKVFTIQLVNTSHSPDLVANAARSLVLWESQMEASRPRRKSSPDLGRDNQVRRKLKSCSSGAANVKTSRALSMLASATRCQNVYFIVLIQELILYSFNFSRSSRHFFHCNESPPCARASLHHSREYLCFSILSE